MKTTSDLTSGSLFVYQTNPVKALTQPESELLIKIAHEAAMEDGDSLNLDGRDDIETGRQLVAKGLIGMDEPEMRKGHLRAMAGLTAEGKEVAERIW